MHNIELYTELFEVYSYWNNNSLKLYSRRSKKYNNYRTQVHSVLDETKSAPPSSSRQEASHVFMTSWFPSYCSTRFPTQASYFCCIWYTLKFFSLFNILHAPLVQPLNWVQYTACMPGQPGFIFSSNIWIYVTQKDWFACKSYWEVLFRNLIWQNWWRIVSTTIRTVCIV